MKLNEWMQMMWLIPVDGAEKYEMCQQLTDAEAVEIMLMIAEGSEFEITSMAERLKPLHRGDPYRNFLESYVGLIIESGKDDKNGWRDSLWNVLKDVDKMILVDFAKQAYHFDLEDWL